MCNSKDAPRGASRREFLCGAGALLGLAITQSAAAQSFDTDFPYVLLPRIKIYGKRGGTIYFAPHSSETTCVQAALSVMKTRGGRLVQIENGDRRNVTFIYKGRQYGFDPNRIFSDTGIQKTLNDKGIVGNYSADAHRLVHEYAESILVSIGGLQGKTLVALHNNGAGDYSLLSYTPGREYSNDVVDLYQNTDVSPHDFFFTTKRNIFVFLKSRGYNVALQDAARMTDDGSMSVYCARKGIPYVNVEAQSGHLAVQTQMISALSGID